ncbi:AbrB/MazE/SpoVT family DNA-binding domain-containing protein [Siminovitchia fortis]|uniref:AbrB/MazE/SpoVT family DNA-binding domain-containing protein n=1 Tax=Siminovitchia fortis TaxID=254758 RepID=UPI0011A61C5B|nr:AbrB/MazE/SpoVT family DNA-binding domain-containing protein [Siminovitchia fortis]
MEERILSTVTEKGQVTIPAKIRNKYNIIPGDKLVYITDDADNIKIKVIKQTSIEDVFGIFKVDSALPFDQEREKALEYMSDKHALKQEGEE